MRLKIYWRAPWKLQAARAIVLVAILVVLAEMVR